MFEDDGSSMARLSVAGITTAERNSRLGVGTKGEAALRTGDNGASLLTAVALRTGGGVGEGSRLIAACLCSPRAGGGTGESSLLIVG